MLLGVEMGWERLHPMSFPSIIFHLYFFPKSLYFSQNNPPQTVCKLSYTYVAWKKRWSRIEARKLFLLVS